MPHFRKTLGLTRRALFSLPKHLGVHPRECPLCGFVGQFHAFGDPPRWDAQCPNCGSLERHRLLGLSLRQTPGLVSGSVIHFGRDPGTHEMIRRHSCHYQNADLCGPSDLRLNLEALSLPSESVDVFVCSHILEHVDDGKALLELYRCLRVEGRVLIMVPIIEGWAETYENPEITDGRERTVHFGQFDHVRLYGRDLRDRIKAVGFDLTEMTASRKDFVKYSLRPGETLFIAQKPKVAASP